MANNWEKDYKLDGLRNNLAQNGKHFNLVFLSLSSGLAVSQQWSLVSWKEALTSLVHMTKARRKSRMRKYENCNLGRFSIDNRSRITSWQTKSNLYLLEQLTMLLKIWVSTGVNISSSKHLCSQALPSRLVFLLWGKVKGITSLGSCILSPGSLILCC